MDFTRDNHYMRAEDWRKYLGYLSVATGYFLVALICFLTPGVLAFLAVQAWVVFEGTTFEDYKYSAGWEVFGWFLELTPIVGTLLVPFFLAFKWWRDEGPTKKPLLTTLFRPTQSWYDTDRSLGGVQAPPSRKSSISVSDIVERAELGKDEKM